MAEKQIDTRHLYYTKKEIKELVSGDILLHPIYRSDGLMLINKDRQLTIPLIDMIKKHAPASTSVLVVSSKEDMKNFVLYNNRESEVFEEESRKIIAELNKNIFLDFGIRNPESQEKYIDQLTGENEKTLPLIQDNFFSDFLISNPLWITLESKMESDLLKIRAIHAKQLLLSTISNNQTFTKLFNEIKDYDDVLLIHSINTMCISLMIGLTLELNKNELIDLSIAALFSNVGFTEIDKEDFWTYLKTYEQVQSQIKRHLEVFSQMTVNYPELRKKNIIYGILEHHECYNGYGYPNGKKGEEISLFGRILYMAHNYDELVGGYNFKIGLHPLEALRIIYENSDFKYDPNILNIFLHRTTYFKLGETISLPNINLGVIVGFDNYIKAPHLPRVKLESGEIINLATN